MNVRINNILLQSMLHPSLSHSVHVCISVIILAIDLIVWNVNVIISGEIDSIGIA